MGVRNATSRYDRSVFLNCPFDDTYKPILDAIMFCIHDSGFVAEIALNDIGTGKTRLAKIVEMIGRCRYSIHDLSRVDEPRLNMAFECGICYGALAFGGERHKSKDLFVLDAEDHRYKKTMSDIAGQDADVHHNDPLKAIDCVRSFLARKSGVKPLPGATYIAQRYRRFTDALPGAASAAKVTIDELRILKYLPDLVNLMVTWQQKNP
ncbi:MAG: hypothetical protein ACREXY_03640 [Gammaproteobacteria bacterium]